jgi:hypothetical protein
MVVVVAVMAVVAVRAVAVAVAVAVAAPVPGRASVDAVLAAAVRAAGRAGAAVRLLRRTREVPLGVALGVARRAERLARELREGQGAAARDRGAEEAPRDEEPQASGGGVPGVAHGAREGAGRPRANDPRI